MPRWTTVGGGLMPAAGSIWTSDSEMMPPQWLQPAGPRWVKNRGSYTSTATSRPIESAIASRKKLKKEPAGPPPPTPTLDPSVNSNGAAPSPAGRGRPRPALGWSKAVFTRSPSRLRHLKGKDMIGIVKALGVHGAEVDKPERLVSRQAGALCRQLPS